MRNIQTEKRNCKDCGQEYDWNIRNIYGYCPKCRKRFYVKQQRGGDKEYKKPYPLHINEQRVRYRRLQRELDNTSTSEERRIIYRRELDFILTNGIWEWCTDIRTQIVQRPGSGKIGRRPHTDSNSEYPNTKDWYE